ncbi:MAG: PaaR repeat-containing protein [Alphaproteobacteria bacterium]|jgi:uncharacterized Zn-binding protein involved in type VI secretion|nr:PaaR repeat-containing protein [Alphaproteobacteria bacterium]
MPAIARLTSMCTGHGCWPPRPTDMASPNVFVEGLGVHRQGDHWVTHCCKSCHDSILAAGSSSVYINGLQCGRVGDPVACGSMVMTGAFSCFAG